jgi:hypothetical protein
LLDAEFPILRVQYRFEFNNEMEHSPVFSKEYGVIEFPSVLGTKLVIIKSS